MMNSDENEEQVSEKVNEHIFCQDKIQPNRKRHRMSVESNRDYLMVPSIVYVLPEPVIPYVNKTPKHSTESLQQRKRREFILFFP